MTSQNSLIFIVYAPALVGADSRTLAAVHGLERTLPGLHLGWRVSEERQLAAVPQRDRWLAEATARGKFPLVCNGDESYPVMISGIQYSAHGSPGGQPQLQVHAELPLDGVVIAAAAEILDRVAEDTRAFWGHASSGDYGSEIAQQLRRSEDGPHLSPRGLPLLNRPTESRSPETPHWLGWFNYWSAATARAIGFPDPARDTELLARARRTANGGWVVRLTDAPLDYNDPTHLDVLKRTYERFPAIGGRSAP